VNVGIAILDTGIDAVHPDLNVVGGFSCQKGASFQDGHGHGTHVAGTAAARDNSIGVVGVAPGAPLYAVRVLNDKGSGTSSSVICGIDWVTANAAQLGIKVVNMSISGKGSDDGDCGRTNKDPEHLAICTAIASGVTYVVAASNEGRDFVNTVPAAYNEVLTVTAITDFDGQTGGLGAVPSNCTFSDFTDDTPTYFSNFTSAGSADAGHTIAAPGHCILSTMPGGSYDLLSGTSMASPHVAGVAALCIASGKCSGGPANVIGRLRSDAAAQPASYGFVGDPRSPITIGKKGFTPHYGYLVYAGGY
jgi:subtilisin family serine protease